MSQTDKTITLVTKATNSLTKVALEISKQSTALLELGGFSSQLSEEIEFKQSELTQLEQKIADETRRKNAELELRVLENADSVMVELLNDRGCVAIKSDDLRDLRQSLAQAEQSNEDAIESAVAAAKRSGEQALQAAVSNAKSTYAVDSANATAEIQMLRTQLSDARDNVAELKEMLNEERKARVEIAQAGTNINLSAPGK